LGSANTALYDRSQPSNALAACDTLQHEMAYRSDSYTHTSNLTLIPDDDRLENNVLNKKKKKSAIKYSNP